MDRANYKESSQEVSKELERTDNIIWGEEDDAWMKEADDSWFTEFVIAYDIVETILKDILNKVSYVLSRLLSNTSRPFSRPPHRTKSNMRPI